MSNNFSAVLTLGKDATTRLAGSNTVTGFSGANNVGYGDKKQTLWLNCSIWGDRGSKLEPYLKKGQQVWVTGELSQREYEGKQYLELNVNQLDLVGKKPDSTAQDQSQHHHGYAPGVDYNDSIPF